MAYFSLPGPNALFCIENMERDLVPLPIIIFNYGDRPRNMCLNVRYQITYYASRTLNDGIFLSIWS